NAFAEAAKCEKAIIFFDDLDKYCEDDGYSMDNRIFVSIQSNIDSVRDKDILVIATVNNIEKLPESLKRNGRFDRKLLLNPPTNDDASKIIEYYLKLKKINENLNIEDVTKMINYTSCADLETILNESAIYATYERKETIDINDIAKAYVRDQYNVPDEEYLCSDEEIEKTALHEAGHVVVAEALKEGMVGFVTIQPETDGRMRGFTHLCQEFKRRPENVLIALGGKVACEQFYEGRCASGCATDLSKALILLRGGIHNQGTHGIGLLGTRTGSRSEMSDSLNERGEAVVQAELERFIFQVKDILLKNKDFLLELTEELKTKKMLFYSDIKRIRNKNKITTYVA
ncbi:MAG: AAA family ATPase, partial [Bacilli bacterium]|nr:AAA family ATPase [Bacilli bacterium]